MTKSSATIISELNEFDLIKRLSEKSYAALPDGVVGVGDDAAVIPLSLLQAIGKAQGSLLLTTDLMVENKHFRLSYFTPYNIGWKLLAVNLSDISAMGGQPLAALITLQLPKDTSLDFVDQLYRGIYQHAEKYGVSIIGGDTSAGEEISLGITMLGVAENPPLLRSGAAVGDDIWVSGMPGQASVGFDILEKAKQVESDYAKNLYLQRFLRPDARVTLGKTLASEGFATSMIDISDGTLQDLGHIMTASKVSSEIDLHSFPAPREDINKIAALCGGEDYELLFTAAPSNAKKLLGLSESSQDGELLPKLTKVGKVLSRDTSCQIYILSQDGESEPSVSYLGKNGAKSGFAHF